MRQYKWKFDKITALSVALINILFVLYIGIRALMDKSFLFTQTGLNIRALPLTVIIFIIIAITIYTNYRFLNRSHRARLFLSACQTLIMACILRNIFVGHLYFGFGFNAYVRNILAFVLVSILIYHTLFSKNIREYFLH